MTYCENLTEISPATHDVALQIAYASPDNFTGAPVYQRVACYLNTEAAAPDRGPVAVMDPHARSQFRGRPATGFSTFARRRC